MAIKKLSEKEKAVLDKQIEKLQDEVYVAKKEYDTLVDQLNKLLIERYPERKEEYIKGALYEAYRRSNKSLELIISCILNEDYDEGD